MKMIKKSLAAFTLAATALVSTGPAAARDSYRERYRDRDNTAAVAIGAGIVGLAVGAIVASSNRDRRYQDRRYYDRRYVDDGRYYRDRRYYNRSPRYRSHSQWRRDDRRRHVRYYNGGYYDNYYYGRRGY